MAAGPHKFQLPHRAVLLVASATAISLLGDQAFYVILQTHYARLGLVALQVGILLSANRWIRLLTNHLAERLTHRTNPTLLLVVALLLGAAVTAAYGLWPFFPALLAARIVWGLCWSLIRQVGIMTCVDTSGGRSPARTFGFYGSIARVGSIGGFVLGGFLFDLTGADSAAFRQTFWMLAAAMLLAALPGAAARRRLEGADSEFRRPRGPGDRNHAASLLICGFIISFVGPGVIIPTFGSVLKSHLGESVSFGLLTVGITTLSGAILALKHATNLLGAPVLGHMVDRIGHRTGTLIFFFAATLVLVVAAVVSNAAALVCLVAMFFACETGLTVAVLAEASKFGSKAYARYASACDFGAAAGPLAVWATMGYVKSAAVPFVIGAGFYVLGTGAIIRMLQKVPAEAPPAPSQGGYPPPPA